jgi:hypothetical protein
MDLHEGVTVSFTLLRDRRAKKMRSILIGCGESRFASIKLAKSLSRRLAFFLIVVFETLL